MRKKSLVPKLIATLSITIIITFVIMGGVLSYLLQVNYFEEKKAELDKGSEIIEQILCAYVNKNESENSLSVALNLISNSLETDILLVDNLGYVYAVSNLDLIELKFKKLENLDLEKLKANINFETKIDNRHIYVKQVYNEEYFMGGIIFITPLNLIYSSIEKIYSIIWISVGVCVILLSLILYYFSRKIIIRPLETINSAARKLANGEIGNRVEIINNDEIGELAESFNTMATSLEEAEQNRREFISNISHELRSPITSVKGFITAILDGVIPKDKEDYYLRIANDEILRLTRLINDLLELSTLQAGKMNLIFTELDINNLIKITVIKMQQKVLEKNIKVQVLLEGEALYVKADNDRIIQVVTNLLDNAIKYCSEGGEIKITSKSKGDKVLITINNNGPSISEQDLKYIWDRFYKADKSRTNKTSTGLGLPIVRNIIVQHGEEIWVENGANSVGVTFNFTLPRI